MENFGMTYDTKNHLFTHEPSGFMMTAQYLMMEDDKYVIKHIERGTGVKVDDFFLDALRYTVEETGTYKPW